MADHLNKILFVLLIFFSFVSVIIVTVEVQGLNMTSWNFTGNELASGFVEYFPYIFPVALGGLIVLVGLKRGG